MERICKNHPKKAVNYCHNCGEPYCLECLNEGSVYYYCNEKSCFKRFKEDGGNVKTTGNKITKAGSIIFAIIVAAIAGTVGKQIANDLFSPSEVIEVESSDWKTQRISHSGLLLETPFELKESTLELPTEYKSMIKEMLIYKYSSEPFELYVGYSVYAYDIIPDLDGAAEGAVNNMRAVKGIENLTHSITKISKGKFPGRMIKGNYKVQSQLFKFRAVQFAMGQKMWQVICTYTDKEENSTVADRIIKSVNFIELRQ